MNTTQRIEVTPFGVGQSFHEVICFRKTRKAAEKYAEFCRQNETPDWVYWVEPVDGGFEVRVKRA